VPKGVHIADSGAYGGGTFGRYENFYGRKWILDFIYILGPTKQLQATPNLGYYKNLICRAAEDPDFVGNWCRPESQLTNVVLEEWLAALFWDPFKVSEQQFLEDYVVRRFGAQSMDNMLASAQEADWAMSYGKAVEYYCSIGSYWHPITFPYILLICDEDDIRRAGLGAESMERSLELALAESADQAGNPLYDYYLEHVFLTYCSRMYLLSLRSLSEAYYDEVHNNGGSQARRRFEQEGSKLVRTCELMARGLSADPNYSVYASNRGGLDDAFSSGYWGNVFFSEVIRLKYRPLAQGMVDWLRQRLNSGNTSLPTVGEIEPVWIKARQDGIAAAKAELASYSAPTVWPPVAETVRSAFEEMKLSGCSAAAYADRLQTPRKHSWLVFSRFGHSPAVEVGAPEPIYDIIDGLGRTEYLYDFGPGRSVRNDFKMVHPTMAYSRTLGYGWENTNGLDGWDSAYPDDLQGDFIYGFAPRTFRVDLPNGRYQVTVFSRHTGFQMGEQRHGHYVSDPSVLRVISDGRERLRMSTRYEVYSPSWLGRFPPELKLDDQFKSGNFEVEVKDGKLRLTFSSPNSIPWTVSGLAIVPVIGKD
jgi:hypothetical protein